MSQHIVQTQHGGQAITVMMGWDRQTRSVFLQLDADNIEEVTEYNFGIGDMVGKCREILCGMNIVVPEAMLSETANDVIQNVGNRVVTYNLDGTICTASKSL